MRTIHLRSGRRLWLPRPPVAIERRPAARYGIALGVSVLALLAWQVGGTDLEPTPFPLLFVAVAGSAVLGGVGPGFVAIGVALLGVATLYFPPEFRPMVSDIRDEVQLAVFAGATTSITLLVGAVRRAQETAERALAAYRRSQQEKELILSTLSHDLKNQLTAVESITFLQRRRLAGVEGEAVEGALTGFQRIDEVVTRLTTLVTQLEDTFRTESRRGELELEECDLVALLGQIADRCRQGTERHCIVVRAGTGSLVGRFDGSQLARVFENLISNAVKYSPDGGEITISVEREESEGKPGAVISVQDRGVGIPTADLPFIFEPRRRGSNVRDTAGTGLGLAGARRIVERHDGTITAESVEGEGTTVTVRLPIQPESERATIRLPTRAVRRA